MTLSSHAVLRYMERVKPALSHPAFRKYKNQKKAKKRAGRKKPPFKPGSGREKAGTIWR